MKQLIPVEWAVNGSANPGGSKLKTRSSIPAGKSAKQCGPKSRIPQIEPWFPSFPLNFHGDLTCFLFSGGFRLYGLHWLHSAYILKSSHLNLENGAAKTSQDDLPKNDYGWGTSWGFMGLGPPLRPSSWSRQSPAAALTLECSQADALSSKGSTKARRKRPDCCKPKLAMIWPTNFKLEARHLAAWWTIWTFKMIKMHPQAMDLGALFILWGRLYPVGILATQRLYEITMQL